MPKTEGLGHGQIAVADFTELGHLVILGKSDSTAGQHSVSGIDFKPCNYAHQV